MTAKEKLLAAQLLKESPHNCVHKGYNDFEFPDDWDAKEIEKFVAGYHIWSGAPWNHTPSYPHLPYFSVMVFLASKLTREVEESTPPK